MKTIIDKINSLDWHDLSKKMHLNGHAIVPSLLSDEQCEMLKEDYENPSLYRKTVEMERYRFGSGTYKYFKYPLPETISEIREFVYPKLVPIANQWMKDLKKDVIFPDSLAVLHQQCIDHGQLLATPLILKYGVGGYNTLHQDLYGEVYFPMQAVLFLNDYGQDYTGGEFVMTQQVPRAQSKAIVLHPSKGSMLIFTTNYRPIKGKKGFYRVSMRHGVSEVRSGERYTMGVIFHDATS